MKPVLKSFVAVMGLLALASQAQALVYTADLGVIFPNQNAPPAAQGTVLGSVTISDILGGGVTVDVSLTTAAGTSFFVNTGGPHTPFAYNLNANPGAIVITTPATFSVAASATSSATPYGVFSEGIDCLTCVNGAPGKTAAPLHFTIAGITTGNFEANSLGYIFAADVLGPDGRSTGSIGASTLVSGVPEPSTWAMMILGFAGVGFMAYRRRKVPALAA
jgi:hypothetical protein